MIMEQMILANFGDVDDRCYEKGEDRLRRAVKEVGP
jgi:hypothetical protein